VRDAPPKPPVSVTERAGRSLASADNPPLRLGQRPHAIPSNTQRERGQGGDGGDDEARKCDTHDEGHRTSRSGGRAAFCELAGPAPPLLAIRNRRSMWTLTGKLRLIACLERSR